MEIRGSGRRRRRDRRGPRPRPGRSCRRGRRRRVDRVADGDRRRRRRGRRGIQAEPGMGRHLGRRSARALRPLGVLGRDGDDRCDRRGDDQQPEQAKPDPDDRVRLLGLGVQNRKTTDRAPASHQVLRRVHPERHGGRGEPFVLRDDRGRRPGTKRALVGRRGAAGRSREGLRPRGRAGFEGRRRARDARRGKRDAWRRWRRWPAHRLGAKRRASHDGHR